MAAVFSSARASTDSRSTSQPFSGIRSKWRTSSLLKLARDSYSGYPGLGSRILAPGRARADNMTSIDCVQPTVR
jgi:hypothetical protein